LPDHDAEHDPVEPDAMMPEADDYMPEAYDEYLTAEALLPNMGTITKFKVIGWKRDTDGNPVDRRNANPILDSREYEVEFLDGVMDVFTANVIAENPEKPRWAMSSEAYVKQAVANTETELSKVDQCLPTCVMTPLSQGY
jgi:hypothetical protein